MKILYVVSGLGAIGGIEMFCKNIVSVIDLNKYKIDFLVNSLVVEDNEKFFIDKGCNIYHIMGGGTVKERNKAKIEFFKHKGKDYDIIHIHTVLTTVFYTAKIAKRYSSAKIIVHSHTASNYKGWKVKNIIARPMLNLFTDIKMACSKNAGEFLFGKRWTKDLQVIYNPIDIEKFAYNEKARIEKRKELGVADNEYLIGTVGRLSLEKNHMFLLDVFRSVYEINENTKLVIVGSGKEEMAIKDKIKALDIESRVILTGQRIDAWKLLSAFDLFVLPSLFEGLPTALIEAQGNNLPIICSKTITDEVVFHNVQKIDIKSKQKWIESMVEKSKNSRKVVSKDNLQNEQLSKTFGLQSVVSKLIDIYEKNK